MPANNEIKSTAHVLPGAQDSVVKNEERVQQAQRGDVAAIRELYLCHHEAIYRFLWSRVHDPDLADDLTGEVFIRMIKALPGYQDRSLPFRAWLYGIARNLVIDHFRKIGPKITRPLKEVDCSLVNGESLEEHTDQNLTFAQVRQSLEKLAADEREVVELRFLAGLSLKETAIAVDKTVAAVKALQHRGLAALKMKITTDEEGA